MVDEVATFDAHVLDRLKSVREVSVETRQADGPVHRTVIWVVVAGGRVLVRSFRGARARWYREACANPSTALLLGDLRIPTSARPATDAASIEALDRGLRAKYAGGASLDAMLRPEVLGTTLELRPR